MAVLTIKGKTTNDSVAIKNPTGDTTYFTAGETSATLGSSVTGIPAAGVSGVLPVGVTGGSGLDAIEGSTIKSTDIIGSKVLTTGNDGTSNWLAPAGLTSLDDYEEGTWTPVVRSWSPSNIVSFVGGTQIFTYTKIGNICTVIFHIYGSAASFAGGSETNISGYPFTAAGQATSTPILIHSGGLDISDASCATINPGDTIGQLKSFAGSGYAFPSFSNSGTTYMFFTMTYRTT